ncbi:MAG: YbhB/YbcL family Raf kinase inhibitor-like protein [Terracidiphilus sp.]
MTRNVPETKARKRVRSIALASAPLVCSSLFLVSCHHDSASTQSTARASLQLDSHSFVAGARFPGRFTCDGADSSPELHWPSPPAGTKSFAIVMSDPDAPADFTHWIAFNLPAGARQLAEGASTHGAMPAGSAEGTNSFGRIGYGGPCPPLGKLHHYVFRIYALDVSLDFGPGASRDQIESAMSGHILAEGQIIGIYGRPGS